MLVKAGILMDDVDRSYYIYLHRDNKTGVPFYVGRGKGKRSYSEENRSKYWKRKVDSLNKGYSVEFIKENLTEDESCALEVEFIKKYGKISDGNGSLVNITDGGRDTSAIMGIKLPDSFIQQLQEDYDRRQHRQLNAKEEKEFLESLLRNMKVFHQEYRSLEKPDGFEVDLDWIICSCIENIIYYAKQRLHKKISFKDFAYSTQDDFEALETDLGEIPVLESTKPFIVLGNKILKYLTQEINKLQIESKN